MTPGFVGFHPGRLWSLLDMFKVEMPKLIDLAREIEAQETLFASIETVNEVDIEEGQAPRWKLSDGDLKTLKARIERMAEFAERSHLGTSHALLVKRKDSPPKTAGEWQVLVDAIQAELEDKLFLFVPPHRARFFALSMKDSSVAAFPIACREIQHAGFCLSAGMFTPVSSTLCAPGKLASARSAKLWASSSTCRLIRSSGVSTKIRSPGRSRRSKTAPSQPNAPLI